MKKLVFVAFLAGVVLLLREGGWVMGGRGGRGGGGGGGRGGAVGGVRPVGGGAVNPYGGGSAGRSSTPILGPAGGAGHAAKGGGSYTTKGGATIDYKGGAVGGITAGGVQGGKYVGGIQVTTPGGREATRVGAGGAAIGPGGGAVAGKSGATVGSGPQGSFGTRYQGGVAIGPGGGVTAGGGRVGAVTGPGGTVVGGSKGVVAGGPYGAAAGRTTVVAGRGTYYRSTTAIRTQGVYVRQGVAHYPCFRPGWYARYPAAWFAAGWTAAMVWRGPAWGTCAGWCGYPLVPIYYDYGENIVYQDNGVYLAGEPLASPAEFAEQAVVLADAGRDAKTAKDQDWLPLGVFAMVQGDEKTSNHIFQLALNKEGVIRGNYYDAVTDSTALIYGAVDKKTQRAAWTVGDRKSPVYEAGIANLTRNETTMLVHYGKDRTQQFSLVRIEEPDLKDAK